MYPVRRQISPHATRLRRELTDVERLVWDRLRNRQLNGFKFRRQVSLGPFIVDFLCFEGRIIVEIDGGQHSSEQDGKRTAWLENQGFCVLRFWNHEVSQNIDGVLRCVAEALDTGNKKTLTQPSPAKPGEG